MANVKDLIKAGLLKENDVLVWKRRVQGVVHEVIVSAEGLIHSIDGKSHKTPSGAAKHLNGNKPVDGWLAWKQKRTGVSLAELRSQIIK
jgi:hypothetical protein